MKKLFAVLAFVFVALYGCSAQSQTAWYTNQGTGVTPYQNIYAVTPCPYCWVRVCSLPTTSSPCSTPTTVTDQYGNNLNVTGGNFGQLQTSVTGLFTFGCYGGNYEIQIAAGYNNIPQQQYNITCPAGSTPNPVGGLYNQTIGSPATGTGVAQTIYTYTVPPNTLPATTGGLEGHCGYVATTGALVNWSFGGQHGPTGTVVSPASAVVNITFRIYNVTASTQWWTSNTTVENTSTGAVTVDSQSGTNLSVNTALAQAVTCEITTSGGYQPYGFWVARVQ